MDSECYEELKRVLNDLCEERDSIQKEIDETSFSIQQAECHVESILKKDDENYKIFSPRNMEDIHRDELDHLAEEKNALQKKNNQLMHERNRYNSIIKVLDKISKEENVSDNLAVSTVFGIQENERYRIARDLHDYSLQNLAHVMHKIELGTLFIDQDPVRAKLEFAIVSKNLKETINEIRNVIFHLRPMTFDDLGLKAAFERLFSNFYQNKYEYHLQIDDVSCEDQMVLLTIYRVVQEALINIEKHAKAEKIFFYCKNVDGTCIIDIEDDGVGFSKEEVESKEDKHFGISLMSERVTFIGGKFEINSEKNKGTKIHFEVPLN